MKDNWKEYQLKTNKNKNIPEYLSFTLKKFGDFKGTAVDLGCGSGRTSEFLVNLGWKVIAIDRNTDVIESIKRNMVNSENLKIEESNFEKCNIPKNDLLYANFSIPFCKKEKINELLTKINNSITLGGRFAGVFFGENDDWKTEEYITIHKKDDVLKLFDDNFEIEYFSELEYNDKTALGKEKHWHNYRVVARKIKE